MPTVRPRAASTRDLSRRATIIIEHPAKTLTKANPGGRVEAVMIRLAVAVLDELGGRPS